MPQLSKDQTRYLIHSASHTLEVLLAFGHPPHRFTPSEVALHLGIDRNQAFRCLKTLQYTGFVRLDDEDRFVLTSLVGQLAVSAEHHPSLMAVSRAHLDEVAQQTEETVNLFVLSGHEMIGIDRRDSARAVRLNTVLGQRVALHAGACPKATLAFVSPDIFDIVVKLLHTLPKHTPHTISTNEQLLAEVEFIRANGYAISDQDFDLEARGVGAPIFNAEGQVIGAISVGGPSYRVTMQTLESFVPVITQAARLISRQLGFIGLLAK